MSKLMKVSFKLLDLMVIFMMVFGSATPALAAPSAQDLATPTITSDLQDYPPGALVTLDGSGWQGDTSVHIVVDDAINKTWQHVDDVSVDENGNIQDILVLPSYFVSDYVVTATGFDTNREAKTTFTDANDAANLDQCANDPYPSPSSDGCSSKASDWINGNMGESKSVYYEGDSLPYRLRFTNLIVGQTNTVTIEWDTLKGGKHAIDYITTFNRTVTTANACLGVAGCDPAVFDPKPIPTDPNTVNQIPGEFRLFGGTINGVSAYTTDMSSADHPTRITITFTGNVANPVLAWAGHISSRADWGADNSAVAIPGSPYHTRLIDLNGSGGNQDRSLSAAAVIFPGSITIIKDAVPNDPQDFSFSTTGGLTPTPFTLDDDSDPALSSTQVFPNLIVTAAGGNNYTVSETTVGGWTLSFGTPVCTVTSPNGGSQSASSSTLSINLQEGENISCTFVNTQQPAYLTLIKTVVNDNGGTAVADDFRAYIDGNVVDWGVTQTVGIGSHAASEDVVSGYTPSVWGGDCTADGSVSLSAGQNKTCTITNDDQQAYITVVKVVNNNHGGTAAPDDFNLTLDGNAVSSGIAVPVKPGTYTAGETLLSGYTFDGFSGDCNSSGDVTVALGESKTCTLTNSDQATYITVVKVVNNNHGGTAAPDDFNLTLEGNAVTSGVAVEVTPGTYTAGETLLSGYTFDGFSGDCNSSGDVTVALGESKTCTLTNSDQQAYITVIKVVHNNHGGTAQPDDFNLTLEGNAVTSAVAVPVDPGTYTADETQLSGYTFDGFSGDCGSNGDVIVALGESKTCTLTNSDQQAYVIVEKVVINDNGGSAQPGDFKLTLDGNPTTSGTKIAVNPGTYTAGETQLSGYTFVGFTGDCDSSGEVTVALGETKTCTLTNDDQQAYVIVNKVVVNDNGGSAQPDDFKLTLDGNATTSGTKIAVNPGAHTAAETQLSSYTFTGFSGDCDNSGKVTVALGETKTCTLTNNDIAPTLTLTKVVINNNGGTAVETDFTLTANGPTPISGAGFVASGADFKSGNYTLSETNLYGYTASSWTCYKNGVPQSNVSSISLGVGDIGSCAITNDDQPGTIIIKKIIKPTGALTSFSFQTTGDNGANALPDYAPFSLAGGEQNSQILDAGSYTVKELVPLGWVLTGIGGSTDPNTPYNCTVTGSGGSTGVGDLSTQTAAISLKNGDTVTCVFENTGQGVTRTQGFWATHPQLANIAWFGGTDFGHTFPSVATTAGIMNTTLCTKNIDTDAKLMGAFWSDISKTSTGGKRSALDQARMQLLQQLIAAELNASAFGSVPSSGSFTAWEAAYCGTNLTAIKTAQKQAASFNSAGDSGTFTPGTSADSKFARSIADAKFWDILP